MAITYTIVSQAPDQELNPAGTGFDQGWTITYQVTSGPASGTTGKIFVTNAQHNAATVGPLIEAKVSDVSDIASLGKG